MSLIYCHLTLDDLRLAMDALDVTSAPTLTHTRAN
jgi:hypothetical protein